MQIGLYTENSKKIKIKKNIASIQYMEYNGIWTEMFLLTHPVFCFVECTVVVTQWISLEKGKDFKYLINGKLPCISSLGGYTFHFKVPCHLSQMPQIMVNGRGRCEGPCTHRFCVNLTVIHTSMSAIKVCH